MCIMDPAHYFLKRTVNVMVIHESIISLKSISALLFFFITSDNSEARLCFPVSLIGEVLEL